MSEREERGGDAKLEFPTKKSLRLSPEQNRPQADPRTFQRKKTLQPTLRKTLVHRTYSPSTQRKSESTKKTLPFPGDDARKAQPKSEDSMERKLQELRAQIEALGTTSPRSEPNSQASSRTSRSEDDPFITQPETETFFHRLLKRQHTLQAAKVLKDLGLRNMLDEEKVEAKWKDVDEQTTPDEKIRDVSDSDTDSDKEDDDPIERIRRACRRNLYLHQRARFLHQNRTDWVHQLSQWRDEEMGEIHKIEGRLESKLLGMSNVIASHQKDCRFLRKGLERQIGLQLANVASKGWFKTGQGGVVDLSSVMAPFLAARGAANRSRSAPGETVRNAEQRPLTFDDVKPFGVPQRRPSLPQRASSVVRRAFSQDRKNDPSQGKIAKRPSFLNIATTLFSTKRETNAMSGVRFAREIGDVGERETADNRRARIQQKMKELAELKAVEGDELGASPLKRTVLKYELFEMTRDESVLDLADWRLIFPRSDLSSILPMLGKRMRNGDAVADFALKHNRRFVRIYSKHGAQDVNSDDQSRNERANQILTMLRNKVDELRDDEEIIANQAAKAKQSIPKLLKSAWVPKRLKQCVMDDEEILRIIRKRYYSEKQRRERLTNALPGGLSAVPLQPPRAPYREHPEVEFPLTSGNKSEENITGERADISTAFRLTLSKKDDNDEGSDEELETQTRENDEDGILGFGDRQFTTAFLSALNIDPNSLLTGDETVAQGGEEILGRETDGKLPGFVDNGKVHLFGCQTTMADMISHAKTPLHELYSIPTKAKEQPAVVLETSERMQAGGGLLRRSTETAREVHRYYQLDADVEPEWVQTAEIERAIN